MEAEKTRALRGRETVSELDSIAHSNRQLQQELASLQRQMRDKQEALQHEVCPRVLIAWEGNGRMTE